jgi:uncharacterized C2H2 Zn-finger protein
MIFTCIKCEKVFARELFLIRHTNRKTPCYKNLSCDRCGKIFKLLGGLNRHLNRKVQCSDKRVFLELKLKIEVEKTKNKQTDLKIEKEKTKQAHLNVGKVINYNIQNIFGDQINYINNIDELDIIKPSCQWDAEKLIEYNNVDATLCNLIKYVFNNDEHPKNKCLKKYDGEIYSKLNDVVVEFKNAKMTFNSKIKTLVNCINYEYGSFSDDEMYKHSVSQRISHISDDNINIIKKVDRYVNNTRNNSNVENVIKSIL